MVVYLLICPNCGKEVVDDKTAFCPSCGKPLAKVGDDARSNSVQAQKHANASANWGVLRRSPAVTDREKYTKTPV